jgi:hypothetical protein
VCRLPRAGCAVVADAGIGGDRLGRNCRAAEPEDRDELRGRDWLNIKSYATTVCLFGCKVSLDVMTRDSERARFMPSDARRLLLPRKLMPVIGGSE